MQDVQAAARALGRANSMIAEGEHDAAKSMRPSRRLSREPRRRAVVAADPLSSRSVAVNSSRWRHAMRLPDDLRFA